MRRLVHRPRQSRGRGVNAGQKRSLQHCYRPPRKKRSLQHCYNNRFFLKKTSALPGALAADNRSLSSPSRRSLLARTICVGNHFLSSLEHRTLFLRSLQRRPNIITLSANSLHEMAAPQRIHWPIPIYGNAVRNRHETLKLLCRQTRQTR